ncbi:MAG: YfhO family protein [Crocinitomicaceae bacterium]
MKAFFKLALPHIVAIVSFVVFSSLFFSPVFQGYSLKQSDVKQYRGMSKEINDHFVLEEDNPLWTNSMFGGMPAYQILVTEKNIGFSYINRILKLGLPRPVALLFSVMLGFYILALCLRVNPWLGIGAAIAYGFCTINILYLGAGHITKVNTIAYMAPTIGGLVLAFRGKPLLGAAVFSLFLGLNLMANHPQMTYYLGFLCLIIGTGELFRMILSQKVKLWSLLYPVIVLVIGSVLALLSNATNLLLTAEYSEYTTRGPTELTVEPNGEPKELAKKSGLDTDYILEYNYGSGELLSMLIPNARGEQGGGFGNNEELMEYVAERDSEKGSDFASNDDFKRQSRYWGGQRFSGGAFYFGVVLFVLFIFGIVFLKDSIKWPVLLLAILAMLLASNDPGGINDYFINHFPLYNKFRDSKMILVMLQIIIPMTALLFLDGLFQKKFSFSDSKKLYITSGIVLFFFAVLALVPTLSGYFISENESKMFADYVESQPQAKEYVSSLKSVMKDARVFLFKKDAARAFGLSLLTLLCLFYFFKRRSSAMVIGLLLCALAIGDNFSISKRYLDTSINNEDRDADRISSLVSLGFMDENEDRIAYNSFEPKEFALLPPQIPSVADQFILSSERLKIIDFDKKKDKFLKGMENHFSYSSINNEEVRRLIADFGVLNQNTNYRVFTLSNPFAETATSYYHKSIGGYHGAKLKRYQELIDFRLGKEAVFMQQNINRLGLRVFEQTPTLNMLNTKYVVMSPGQRPVLNNNALGNAWFVSDLKRVKDGNSEIIALSDSSLNLRSTAVVHNDFTAIQNIENPDLGAVIKMVKYRANAISYTSSSKTRQHAIFSEIYYPKGWNCYINGKLTSSFRANYILRGVTVPAGDNDIEWRFEPSTYVISKTISSGASLVLLLMCAFIFSRALKKDLKYVEVG